MASGSQTGKTIFHGLRRWVAALKLLVALHHSFWTGLQQCLRALRRTRRRGGDEMPFSLALTLELNWLSMEQRGELEALGSNHPGRGRTANVVDIAAYLPERPLRHRLVTRPPPPPRWNPAPALFVTLACLAIVSFFFLGADLSPGEYMTGTGEQHTIPLADGSKIILNTRSRLRVRFTQHGRDIELLEGEALFSVAKDTNRPFRVHVRHTIVEALGTQFSIYLGNSGTKIAVTQGRVRVFENLNPTPVIVDPNGLVWTDTATFPFYQPLEGPVVSAGQEASVDTPDRFADFEVQTRRVGLEELERRLAWVNGSLFFSGETLGEAVEEFNRYNYRKLKVTDPTISQIRLGGKFETTNLDSFVQALKQVYGIRAEVKGDPGAHDTTIELKRRPTGPP